MHNKMLKAMGLGVVLLAVLLTAAGAHAEEAAAVEEAQAAPETGAVPAAPAEEQTPEPEAPTEAPREDAAASQRPVAAFWFVVPGR